MVQIDGKYKLDRHEKFFEYLVAMGLPEEKAKVLNERKTELEISIDGNKFIVKNLLENSVSEFVFGEEIDDPVSRGIVLKSKATKVSDDTIEISSVAADGKSGKRIYQFNANGLLLTITSSKEEIPNALGHYVRV